MNKILTLIIILLFTLSAKAQDLIDTIPKVKGEYTYLGVVNLDSTYKKDDLYKNAKLYFVDNFKSSKDVIQYDDKEEGKIIGKGFFSISELKSSFTVVSLFTWNVYYSTEITCKNGKYRYRLYGFSIEQNVDIDNSNTNSLLTPEICEGLCKRKNMFKKTYISLDHKMVNQFLANIEVIKSYLLKKGSASKDDSF